MEIDRAGFDAAVMEAKLSDAQAGELWAALSRRQVALPTSGRFDAIHVAYYFGALLVIGAMGFFMTLGWESLGGGFIAAVALAYATTFVLAGRSLGKRGLEVPSGLLYTMAVCMAPLATYGIERVTGLWPDVDPGSYRGFHEWIKGGWIAMELCTIAASLVALRRVRFAFLTAPLAFTAWYMSMDLAPILFGSPTWNERAGVSIGVGLVLLLAAYLVDRRTRVDYAFWLYLFGLFAFWGGLSSMEGGSELRRFIYFLINLGLMVTSVLLVRRVFLVFGSLGAFGYLGYVSWHVFEGSIAFPFVLTGIGLAVIALAVKYHRHRLELDQRLQSLTPDWLKSRLPSARSLPVG